MPTDFITNDVATAKKSQVGEFIFPVFSTNGDSGFNYANPYWYMQDGFESIGSTDDEMTFLLKAENVANYDFDMVMNLNGVLNDIKFDTPMVALRRWVDNKSKYRYDVCFAGYVKNIRQVSHALEQYIEVTCTSVKKAMRDILVRGSYCYDGTTVVYRDAIPLHMNRGGRPDWIWTPGGTPMPALNCDFGIETDTEPPDPTQQSSEQATYCTLGMLLRYLNAFYGPDADTQEQLVQSAIETALEFNTALDRLPNTFPFQFDWPRTFGQEIDQFVIGNFNNAVGQNNTTTGGARKGRDIRFRNGQPLIGNPGEMGVFDAIFSECGGFSWAIQFGPVPDDGQPVLCTLACVPTRLFASIASLPLVYAGGKESAIPSVPIVREFDYSESCNGQLSRLVGIGSSVKIETRISNDTDAGCLYGFTNDDFEYFKSASVQSNATNEDLMNLALKGVPHLFSRFVFDPAFDFSANTDYAAYPKANAPRPIWPYLLTYEGAEISTQANDIVPYPIRVEVDTGSGYVDAGFEMDGLISWDNGYFELLAMREVGINRNDSFTGPGARHGMFTWGSGNDNGIADGAWGGVKAGKLNITLNKIRVTVAIPHDATLNISSKLPSDNKDSGNEGLYIQAPDSPDANRMDKRFTRTMIVDLSRLYDLWLRINSYPIPEVAGGWTGANDAAPDRPTLANAIRNNTELLSQNVTKSLFERNRLQRSGYFQITGMLLPPQVYPLGQQISSMVPFDDARDAFPLNCCIQRREWKTVNMGTKEKPLWTSRTRLVPI